MRFLYEKIELYHDELSTNGVIHLIVVSPVDKGDVVGEEGGRDEADLDDNYDNVDAQGAVVIWVRIHGLCVGGVCTHRNDHCGEGHCHQDRDRYTEDRTEAKPSHRIK